MVTMATEAAADHTVGARSALRVDSTTTQLSSTRMALKVSKQFFGKIGLTKFTWSRLATLLFGVPRATRASRYTKYFPETHYIFLAWLKEAVMRNLMESKTTL